MAEAGKKAKKEKIPRQPMPEQAPDVRNKNFDEVPFGLSPESAMKEAERCLQCKKTGLYRRMPGGGRYPWLYRPDQSR